jgi:ABC-type uncharacterized transport system substrate-binding protein
MRKLVPTRRAALGSWFALTLFAIAMPALAQDRPTVGVLFGGPKGSAAIAAFVKAMEELGYVDGKTVSLSFHYADGKADQLRALAIALVAQQPKVIVGVASDAVIAAAKATTTIPIVSASGDLDFVGAGLAKSMDKPGGNVTGMSISAGEAAALRVQLLKKAVPGLATLLVLTHPSNAANPRLLEMMKDAAQQQGVTLQPVVVSKAEDLEPAIVAAKGAVQAASTLQGPFFFFQRKLIADLCAAQGLPLGISEPLSAESGAFLQVNPDVPGTAAASAKYVDRILKGESPAVMQIVRHLAIQVVLNMKVAKALNLTIDPSFATGARIID